MTKRDLSKLIALGEYMSRLPALQVNMNTIVRKLEKTEPPCGAVACAVGHAAVMGAGEDVGIYWDFEDSALRRDNGGLIDWDVAGAKMFDLGIYEAQQLFAPESWRHSSDTHQRMFLRRLRSFLKENDVPASEVSNIVWPKCLSY